MMNILNFMVQILILILIFGKMPFHLKFHQLELVRNVNCYFKKKKTRGSSSSTQSLTSKLQSYLTTTFEFVDSPDFDILQWWKEHQRHFPILDVMAKQILAIPVSIVVVEQQFSAGGNILDSTRSSMSPDSIEAQSCLDDWTKVVFRQQEKEHEQMYEFFENEQTTGTEGSDADD